MNEGELIYSKSSEFSASEHGYKGISFDISKVSIGGTFGFTGKDTSAAKAAIDTFVTNLLLKIYKQFSFSNK